MGTSTDAILAFGFNIGDPDDERLPKKIMELGTDEDSEYFDEDLFYQNIAGLTYPPDDLEGKARDKALKVFWSARDKAKEASPVDFITHCSYDYPMYFMAVKGTERKASRGYPVSLKLDDITAPEQSKLDAFKAFCEQYEIEWQEPSWHIFSMWG